MTINTDSGAIVISKQDGTLQQTIPFGEQLVTVRSSTGISIQMAGFPSVPIPLKTPIDGVIYDNVNDLAIQLGSYKVQGGGDIPVDLVTQEEFQTRNEELDTRITSVERKNGAAPYPVTTSALPQTATNPDIPDRASSVIYGDTSGRTYTQTGGSNITVSANKARSITYDRTTNLWTAGQEFTIPQDNAFSQSRVLLLGTLIDGRYTSASSLNTDGNTAYKIMQDFLEVQPSWLIYSSNVQSSNSFSWCFDEFRQPLSPIVPVETTVGGVTMYRLPLHPKTRFIRMSGANSNMTAKVLTVTNAFSVQASTGIAQQQNIQSRQLIPYQDNQFSAQELVINFYVAPASTDGAITPLANMRVTPMTRLVKPVGRMTILNIPSNSNSSGVAFYKQDGTFISNVNIPNTNLELNGLNNGFLARVNIPNGDPYYFRYWFDQRLYQSNTELINNASIVYSGAESSSLVNNVYKGEALNAQDIRDIIRSERKVKKNISDLVVLVLGDSNTENSGGRGSWNNMFLRLMRPRIVRNRAVAGATVTSTENLFGVQYTTGGNTLLKQCELEIQAFNADPTNFPKPDLIIITGGTNDFDLSRFVTPAAISTFPDYHEAMESTFVTESPSYNIKKNLETIDRGKIGGAIRYIHERFLNTFPDAVQILATPLRSTLHNQVSAKRLVEEMIWMGKRWQLPIVDVFNHGGISTVRDFGADRFNLTDRVHVFNETGQSRGSDIYGMFVVDNVYKNYVPLTLNK